MPQESMEKPENRQAYLESASSKLDKLATEVMMVGDNFADLPTIVSIVELFGELKSDGEKVGDPVMFQSCFASEEILSSILCERFSEPEGAMQAVRNLLDTLKSHVDKLAQGPVSPENATAPIAKAFELLEVPVVKMPGEVSPALIGSGDASAESSTPFQAEQKKEDGLEIPITVEMGEEPPKASIAPEPASEGSGEMVIDEENLTTGLPENMEDPDLYREFVFECSEHLETIEEKILDLEDSPDDADLINEIFRPIHSMKGGAGFLSLTGMQNLAHATETLLDRARKSQITVTARVVEICLRSVDALKTMVANLTQVLESSNPSEEEVEPVVIGPIRKDIEYLLENPAAALEESEASPVATQQPAAAQPVAPTPAPAAPKAEAAPEPPAAPKVVVPKAPPPIEEEGDLNDPEYAHTGFPESFGDDEDDIELLKRFIQQCNEHLETIEEKILSLENDPNNGEIINEIFRAMHSIKGDAGFLNLNIISRIAHETETLFDKCRKQEIEVTTRVIELCLQSSDVLKKMSDNLSIAAEKEKPEETQADPIVYGPVCKAIARYLEDPVAGEAEAQTVAAPQEEEKPPPPRVGELLVESGEVSQRDVEDAVNMQGAPVGEILVRTGKAKPEQVQKALEKQTESGGAGASGGSATARAIKVDTEKIDKLVNLVGELVIIEAQVAQMAQQNGNRDDQVWDKNLNQLSKITKELQDRSMSLRMMPIKQTFQKMTRLVRDSSKKMNKKVNLVLIGEDTELDKTVVEQIGDPLVHMLRNSVDHGVETPAERLAAGKPETGTINLEAFYQGDRILIRVRDDGKGLDRERILEKARENQLIGPEATLTDSEIYNMIFMPGFSTAKQVTDISGRGVGMDVVRRNIDKLRGIIETESTPGKGTVITISLPLTLAIIDGMVVRIGEEEYIIPTASIQESMQPSKDELTTVTKRGEMVNVRGSLIPLIRLYELWNIEPNATDPTESLVVIVENKGARGCVMVDELVGQQQIVIKTLGEQFGNVKGITGATILGSGRVGLILDVEGILNRAIS